MVKSTTKEDMEDYIFDEIEYRFELAMEAPISRIKLINQLGYLGHNKIPSRSSKAPLTSPTKPTMLQQCFLKRLRRLESI